MSNNLLNQVLRNRYTMQSEIARGGMGYVYLAWDEQTQHEVAVKYVPFGPHASGDKDLFESALLQQLDHDHLPKIYEAFRDQQGHYLVMEYIPGDMLKDRVKKKHFLPDEAVIQILPLLKVLQYLHERTPPIIHRDIKPSNLKFNRDGRLMLVDFGIAKQFVQSEETRASVRGAHTPGYAPPEQIFGQGTDQRSDLFTMGAVLYFMLTGAPPRYALERYADKQEMLDPTQMDPMIPLELGQIISRATALDMGVRYTSAAEMYHALIGMLPSLASSFVTGSIPVTPPVINSGTTPPTGTTPTGTTPPTSIPPTGTAPPTSISISPTGTAPPTSIPPISSSDTIAPIPNKPLSWLPIIIIVLFALLIGGAGTFFMISSPSEGVATEITVAETPDATPSQTVTEEEPPTEEPPTSVVPNPTSETDTLSLTTTATPKLIINSTIVQVSSRRTVSPTVTGSLTVSPTARGSLTVSPTVTGGLTVTPIGEDATGSLTVTPTAEGSVVSLTVTPTTEDATQVVTVSASNTPQVVNTARPAPTQTPLPPTVPLPTNTRIVVAVVTTSSSRPAPTRTEIPPTEIPPTVIPPTAVPPTAVPPTAVPPTAVPPTAVPPTAVPPTAVPPTAIPPTAIPPTAVPPTAVPPTAIPPTAIPPTAIPPTSTSIPPTATSIPPTATPIPPTATEIPPTATSVPPTGLPPTQTPRRKVDISLLSPAQNEAINSNEIEFRVQVNGFENGDRLQLRAGIDQNNLFDEGISFSLDGSAHVANMNYQPGNFGFGKTYLWQVLVIGPDGTILDTSNTSQFRWEQPSGGGSGGLPTRGPSKSQDPTPEPLPTR